MKKALKDPKIERIMQWYATNGRHHLPWRATRDPYTIAVSEIMLQQTQVDRVIPKFEAWMKQFPTAAALAQASTPAVLSAWQGLGYNRRALALKNMAECITTEHGGQFPQSKEELMKLPGIGPYTSVAIRAFAFHIPDVCIETNIRTVFMHLYFEDRVEPVSDAEILPLIERALSGYEPHVFYAALMDYGTHLKQTLGKHKRTSLHKKSARYSTQSRFAGSTRELRAAIMRTMLKEPTTSRTLSYLKTKHNDQRLETCIASLVRDGLLKTDIKAGHFSLPE